MDDETANHPHRCCCCRRRHRCCCRRCRRCRRRSVEINLNFV